MVIAAPSSLYASCSIAPLLCLCTASGRLLPLAPASPFHNPTPQPHSDLYLSCGTVGPEVLFSARVSGLWLFSHSLPFPKVAREQIAEFQRSAHALPLCGWQAEGSIWLAVSVWLSPFVPSWGPGISPGPVFS